MSIPINELVQSPVFVTTYFVAIIGVIAIALANKFVLLGIKLLFMRSAGKHGLVFFRNKSGNIGLPVFAPLDKGELKVKKKGVSHIYAYARCEFEGPKFFGFPFTIKDQDDASRSYGLYAPEYDPEGNPKKETVVIDGKIFETNNDKLTTMKDGYRVDPEVFDGLIAKHKMLDGLKEIWAKNQLILVAVIAAVAVALISTYLSYENFTMTQETIIPLLKEIAAKAPATATIIGG